MGPTEVNGNEYDEARMLPCGGGYSRQSFHQTDCIPHSVQQAVKVS